MTVTFEDLIGSGSSSDYPISGEVANYSALPSAATVSGQTYRVLAEQGTWFLGTLKRAGHYYSNGVSWTHLGESSYLVKAHDTSVSDNALVKYHSTDGQSIQESGVIVDDSDNVTGIVNITTTGTSAIFGNFSFEANQTVGAGQDNYVLTYDHGDGKISLEAAASSGLANIVEDLTPQLGGSLDVNGQKIVSVSNGNIDIEPHGTGNVLLGNFSFNADQTVGAGQDNYVLTYDDGTGLINLEASAGGNSFQTIAVSGQSDVVADSASDTLTLVAGTNITITTNAGTDTITINSTGGSGTFDYGMAYVISSGQFSS